MTFWVDGVQKGNLTGIDNDTHRMEQVRLGATYLSVTGISGTFYIDAFESRRQTYMGPRLVRLLEDPIYDEKRR